MVTATFPGDLKKPRPAVVMQADEFKDGIGKRFGTASHDEMLQLELALITIAGLDRYLLFDEPSTKDS